MEPGKHRMSGSKKDQEAPATVEAQSSVTIDSAPDTEFLKRRMLLKGAATAAPLILTLRAGPALASASNCAVVEMTPTWDPTGGIDEQGGWSFQKVSDGTTGMPHMDQGGIPCYIENSCPVTTTGYFDSSPQNLDDPYSTAGTCPNGGIIIAASSGGSFTH